MNTSKNNQNKMNEGGKKVINNPEITEIISNNKETNPEQYQEKVNDGVRTNDQPLQQGEAPDESKALEAGDK